MHLYKKLQECIHNYEYKLDDLKYAPSYIKNEQASKLYDDFVKELKEIVDDKQTS